MQHHQLMPSAAPPNQPNKHFQPPLQHNGVVHADSSLSVQWWAAVASVCNDGWQRPGALASGSNAPAKIKSITAAAAVGMLWGSSSRGLLMQQRTQAACALQSLRARAPSLLLGRVALAVLL